MLVNRNWFYEVTKKLFSLGTRFRNGDKPNQNTFENLTDSVVFKTETSDKAKEDTGEFVSSNNGHVVLATDEQVRNLEEKQTDRSLVVQPSQTTTVSTQEQEQIDDYEGIPIETDINSDVTSRKDYVSTLSSTFKAWLLSRLIIRGGTTGQLLAKTSNNDYETEWVDAPTGGTTGNFIPISQIGVAGGVTPLGNDIKVPIAFLPDEVLNSNVNPGTSTDTNKITRKADNIVRAATTTDGLTYTITSPTGLEYTGTYPSLLIVTFNAVNTGNVSLEIDGLNPIELTIEDESIDSGDLPVDTPMILYGDGTKLNTLTVSTTTINGGIGNVPATPKITIPATITGTTNQSENGTIDNNAIPTLADFTFTSDKSGLDSGDSNFFVMPYNGKIGKIEFSINQYKTTGNASNGGTLTPGNQVILQVFKIDSTGIITDLGNEVLLADISTGMDNAPTPADIATAPISLQNKQQFVDISLQQGDLIGVRFETGTVVSSTGRGLTFIDNLEIGVVIEQV